MRISTPLTSALRPNVSVIVAAGALALTLAVGGAQASELQEVTVSAPTVKTVGRDVSGAPIKQVTASARVQYNPLMLTTNSGRALLHYKIAEVARKLCRQIDTVALAPMEDEDTCVQRAVDGTKVQIAAAAAGQKAG